MAASGIPESFYRQLAQTCAETAWTRDDLAAALRTLMADAGPHRWIAGLVERLLAHFGSGHRPWPGPILHFLQADRGLRRVWYRRRGLAVVPLSERTARMWPARPFAAVALPALTGVAELTDFLQLPSTDHLRWFADSWQEQDRPLPSKLRHYHSWAVRKAHGDLRWLEAPKAALKELQRRLLARILAQLPVHSAAQAFVPGRGPGSHAAWHAGRPVVAQFDLADFFPSIGGRRVRALWHAAGYPPRVAGLLTGLTTTVLPATRWLMEPAARELAPARRQALLQQYGQPHLPQGAPTSPTLANLVAWRLDRRLTGLALPFGWRYSRYADDLCFSGGDDLRRRFGWLRVQVDRIARDCGFRLRQQKSRRASANQQQLVTGLVVNVAPQIARCEVDRLRAILHDCQQHGPAQANRQGHPCLREHLRGRIAQVARYNAGRGARLMRQFAAIEWYD